MDLKKGKKYRKRKKGKKRSKLETNDEQRQPGPQGVNSGKHRNIERREEETVKCEVRCAVPRGG